MLLSDVSNDRNNNLNIIRFIAAIMVIYSHSFALSLKIRDPLSKLTNGQTSFGRLAVCIFFFFSGFLVSRSVAKKRNVYCFIKSRSVRIFPPLFTVVSFSAFILGGIISELDILEYFTNRQTYLYLANAVFILRHNLPGVFENNIYGKTVNGALWTIPVEFVCYIVCCFMYKFGLLKEKRMKFMALFLGVIYLFLDILLKSYPFAHSALLPCAIFYMGMLYYTYCNSIPIYYKWVLACLLGLVVSIGLGIWRIGALLFLPYVLVYLAFETKIKISEFGKKHEISYGIYLSAFPIQQTIIMLNQGSMNPIINFLLSVPIAIFSGYIINIFIEKPLKRFC